MLSSRQAARRGARRWGRFQLVHGDADDIESYIALGNTTPMHRRDKAGRLCHYLKRDRTEVRRCQLGFRTRA